MGSLWHGISIALLIQSLDPLRAFKGWWAVPTLQKTMVAIRREISIRIFYGISIAFAIRSVDRSVDPNLRVTA